MGKVRCAGDALVVSLCLVAGAACAQSGDPVFDQATLLQIDQPAGTGEPFGMYLTVIDALEKDGYVIVSVDETLLKRMRIRARNGRHLREIVVSRSSGGILRDALVEVYPRLPGEEPSPPVPIEQILQNTNDGINVSPLK